MVSDMSTKYLKVGMQVRPINGGISGCFSDTSRPYVITEIVDDRHFILDRCDKSTTNLPDKSCWCCTTGYYWDESFGFVDSQSLCVGDVIFSPCKTNEIHVDVLYRVDTVDDSGFLRLRCVCYEKTGASCPRHRVVTTERMPYFGIYSLAYNHNVVTQPDLFEKAKELPSDLDLRRFLGL